MAGGITEFERVLRQAPAENRDELRRLLEADISCKRLERLVAALRLSLGRDIAWLLQRGA